MGALGDLFKLPGRYVSAYSSALGGIPQEVAMRQAAAQMQLEALRKLGAYFGGGQPPAAAQPDPAPSGILGAPPDQGAPQAGILSNIQGPITLPALTRAAMNSDQPQAPVSAPAPRPQAGHFPTLDEAAPALALATLAGLPQAGGLRELLTAEQPNVQVLNGQPYDAKDPTSLSLKFRNPSNVNGTIVDLWDPSNIGRQIPTVSPDRVVDYGVDGKPVGERLLPGADRAAHDVSFATKRGEAEANAPYDYVDVPQPDGTIRRVPKDVYAKTPQIGITQSPNDATYGNPTAEGAAKRYQAWIDAGNAAPQKIGNLQEVKNLLAGYRGGKLGPAGVEIASALHSIGFDIDPKLGNKQAAAAVSNKLVLDAMGGSLGTGISNADRDFIVNQTANLSQSEEGRNRILDMAITVQKRNADVAAKARAWQQRFGRIDAADSTGKSFEDYLASWSAAHPLFAK